ncbi:MAG: DUF1624 domain-containing protein [Cyclobacteriaceae bacterium]
MIQTSTNSNRVVSIDLLRGVVMILMALDHIRDYFHYDAFYFVPTVIEYTNSPLFFTRFITHFCAPVFVFLAGTSAFFVGRRLDKKSLSIWLIKRGLWLVFLEFTVVKFAWYFQLDFSLLEAMVIWALGIGMICLAGAIHLPKKWIIVISLIGIAGHNLLDGIQFDSTWAYNLLAIFHESTILKGTGSFVIWSYYPLIPWIFLMPLGYCMGELYTSSFPAGQRTKILMQIGLGLTVGFFVLRLWNVYGDLEPWATQPTFEQTVWSFFNVTKYPPSLLYLMITMGPSLIFLSIAEKWSTSSIMEKIITLGRVPMFFYLIHLFVIHLLAMLAAVMMGWDWSFMILEIWITDLPRIRGYGFSLPVVYVIWISMIVFILYPLSKAYHNYKMNNKDRWWLSYL